MKTLRASRLLLLAAVLGVLGGIVACSTDSPSEPTQTPAPTPPGTPPVGDFTITVTVNPGELTAGQSEGSTVTVRVRRRDNNQPPAQGTTVSLSTTLGSLGNPGSGVQTLSLQLTGGDAQTTFFAGTQEGNAVIQARLQGSVGQASVTINPPDTFFVAAVSPNTGSPDGGDTVMVTGGGFEEPVRVLFAGTPAPVLSVSASSISVRTPASTTPVPAGSTSTVSVQVTINVNEIDQAIDTLPNAFIYVPGGGNPANPIVLGVTPTSGPNEGGTTVRINGDGFVSPVQVIFGTGTTPDNFQGVEATVQSVTSSQIVVVTPSATGFGQNNQNSQVDLLVRNLATGFATVSQSAFRYGTNVLITAVSPNEIDFDSQVLVTIFGQGFDEPVAVSLGGLGASPISVTGTEIVVRAPVPVIEMCSSITGDVAVTNIETGDSTSVSDAFTYRVLEPVVTGVSPNSGPGAGGTAVTVSGLRFDPPVRVFFGDSAGSVTAATGSSISVTTPSFSDFSEESCDDDGDGTQGMRFVRTSVDVTVENLITDCDDIFTGGYTYIPADTSCRGDAGPPPPNTPECSDGLDNDGDFLVDHASVNAINPDPECTGPNDNDESVL